MQHCEPATRSRPHHNKSILAFIIISAHFELGKKCLTPNKFNLNVWQFSSGRLSRACRRRRFFRGSGYMARPLQHVHGADGRQGRNARRWAAAGGVAAGWVEGNKSRLPYHGAFLIDPVDGGSVSGRRPIPW